MQRRLEPPRTRPSTHLLTYLEDITSKAAAHGGGLF